MSRPYGRRPPYRSRDRLGFWPTMWLSMFGIIMACAVFGASHAHAAEIQRPSICTEFDSAPTFATVNAVMTALTANGRTVTDAANLLAATVEQHCSQHFPLLQAYVDAGVFLYPELSR